MPSYLIAIIVVISVAAGFAAVMFVFALYAMHRAFGGRFDKNKNINYFSAKDFSLDAVPVETHDKKIPLRGYIYTRGALKEAKALIVFSHGMGPGQCAYTTEIAYFCNHGFAVLAFDCAGCGLSGGKSMRGMESSTRALVAAAKFASADERLKNLKMFYFGHSMGAYSALCATVFFRPAGTIALSAPERPSLMVQCGATPVIGKFLARFLRPFVSAASRMRFGKYGDMSASRAIKRSGVPAIIFHGALDETVPLPASAYAAAEGGRAERVLCGDKAHNPYNTVAAEAVLKELGAAILGADKKNGDESAAFISSINFNAACEEDEKVMSAVLGFISGRL